jgi:hypothetical protein
MGQVTGNPPFDFDERLGRVAVQRAFITPDQLETAVEVKEREGLSLRDALVGLHLVTVPQILRLEAEAAAAPAFPPLGRFLLSRELGRGTSAVVYEAVDTASGQRVALKVFQAGPAADADRFLREGALAAKLPAHPGIVAVLETGEVHGCRYLALEIVDGLHLDQWIRQGSVPFPAYVEVLRDAARAVDHAHRFGIIHRDLKPENILVDNLRRARVTDFGLAKTVSTPAGASVTATGLAVGTPAYMSPEQIRADKNVDRRTDVWALGVMLYEGLTGARPFDGATAFEAMTKAVTEDPPAPSKASRLKMNPNHFRTIEQITLKALAKEPRHRYPTAAAFADDLTRWLNGERFDLKVPPATRKLVPRSRKIVPILAALVAGAVGAGLVFLGAPGDPARPALAPQAASLQPGAILEVYGGVRFNTLGLRDVDRRPRFADPGDPVWRDGPEVYVSLRWAGRLRVPKTGTYAFSVRGPESVRLSISRAELVSPFGGSPGRERSGRLRLERGLHDILLEATYPGPMEDVALTWGVDGAPAVPLGPGDLLHEAEAFRPVSPPAGNGPAEVPGAQEGEALEIVDASSRVASVKNYAPYRWFWNGRWSGNGHLWWGLATRKGDTLTVAFRSRTGGRRTLVLALTRAMDHGVFQISVNGRTVHEGIDLYAADLATGEIEIPGVEMKPGRNELRFLAIDSNAAAREWGPDTGLYKLGLDYVLVR